MNTRIKQYKAVQGIRTSNQDDLLHRFFEQVQTSPASIAVITTTSCLSYQDLFAEVLRWKEYFSLHLPLKAQNKVIVCLDRTPRMLAVLLALQCLEICYIPVDMSIPIERLQTIIANSEAAVFLHDIEKFRNPEQTNLACLQCNLADVQHAPQQNNVPSLPLQINQDATVYTIYTSGSTGTPKGVAIPRRAFNNFLASMSRYFLQEDESILLAITTLAFDIAVLELFLPIWQKKTVFIANEEQHQDPASLNRILNDYPIALLQATPAMWQLLAPMQWQGKSKLVALCGGEPLPTQLAKSLLAEVGALWNMYGPTEATVWCSLKQIKQIKADVPITVGSPIDNTEMCVMDADLNILPANEKGDLYIAGLCLANGYVNNKQLTDERFIPYKDALEGRIYRVGDIASQTAEGEFIIYGRTDNQIKLHGYRIELEDIEAQIQSLAMVRQCAVSVHNEQLIAYVCLTQDDNIGILRKALATLLPEYMLPQRFIVLDKLPLLVSGKIDRKSLPAPSGNSSMANPENPQKTIKTIKAKSLTPMQLLLSTIWAKELGLASIHLHDNFFFLGGHSLSAARIALKIAQQTGKQINLRYFYQAPTLAEFAKLVTEAPTHNTLDNTQLQVTANKQLEENAWLPLYDFQFTVWIARLFAPSLNQFNNVARRRIQGPLDKKLLDLALQWVVQQQGILTYTIKRFNPLQKQQQLWSIEWQETSLRFYETAKSEAFLARSFNDMFVQSLWTNQAPMMMAKLFYLKDNQIELQISISHFLSDEDSMEIFFQELSKAYLYYAQNASTPRPDFNHASQAFIHYILQQNEITTKYIHNDASFWEQYFKDADYLYLPKRAMIKKRKSEQSSYSTYFEIPTKMLSNMHRFCMQHQISITDLFCAAIGLSLRQSGIYENENFAASRSKLLINIVKSTRNDSNYDKLIGCFLNVDALKLDCHKHRTLLSLAKEAQQSAIETMEYQRAPAMVKYASLCCKHRFKKRIIAGLSFLFGKILYRFNPNLDLLKAVLTLMFTKPKNSFVVNVNIFSNFSKDKPRKEKDLFNAFHRPIPFNPYPILLVKNVFDITFHRNGEQNTPYMVITSNISSEMREEFGKIFLEILQREFMQFSKKTLHITKDTA